MQILIVRLSALTPSIIDCRCFSANYLNISHSGNWVLRTKGKHSSRIMDNGALPSVNLSECRFGGASYVRGVPD